MMCCALAGCIFLQTAEDAENFRFVVMVELGIRPLRVLRSGGAKCTCRASVVPARLRDGALRARRAEGIETVAGLGCMRRLEHGRPGQRLVRIGQSPVIRCHVLRVGCVRLLRMVPAGLLLVRVLPWPRRSNLHHSERRSRRGSKRGRRHRRGRLGRHRGASGRLLRSRLWSGLVGKVPIVACR